MKEAERLLRNLDGKLVGWSIDYNELYRTNILLTRIFRPDWKGVLNGLNSYREAVTLIPKHFIWWSPTEHSERGNFMFALRTPLGDFQGWSYSYEYSVLRALLDYKIAEVKITNLEADRVAEILSSEPV